MSGFRTFLVVCFAETFSVLGTHLTGFALGVWALESTASVTWFSMFALAATAPRLLLAPVAGWIVDHWDRRRVLIFGHAASGACTLVAAGLFAFEVESLEAVLSLVALASLLGAGQYPALQASMTLLVEKSQLPRGSGFVHLGLSSAQVLAPATAGLLLGKIGVAGILLVDVSTFTTALVLLAGLRIPSPPVSRDEQASAAFSARQLLIGLAYVRQRPPLLAFLGLFAGLSFCLGLAQILVTPLILSFADEVALGGVLSQAGLGMLVGSLLMVAWGGSGRLMRAISWLCVLQGTLLVATACGRSVGWIGPGLFLTFALRPLLSACSAAIWQRKVPPEMQGRVFAARSAVVQGALPVAYLLAGPLSDRLFEPLMAQGSLLAGLIGPLWGAGPGRGIALLIAVLGILILLLGGFTRALPALWQLEEKLPDRVF